MKKLILFLTSIIAFCSFKIAPKALSVVAICAVSSANSQTYNWYPNGNSDGNYDLQYDINSDNNFISAFKIYPGKTAYFKADSILTSTDTLTHSDFVRWDIKDPIATVQFYAGSVAPTGYLICDGSAVSRTTYSALFAICGTTYGNGDGSTTFNLPDLRQRFALGKAVSGTGNTLGATGGTIDHVHAVDPPNTTTSAPTGTIQATNLTGTAANTTHTHDVNIAQFNSGTSNPPFLVLNAIIKY